MSPSEFRQEISRQRRGETGSTMGFLWDCSDDAGKRQIFAGLDMAALGYRCIYHVPTPNATHLS
jgi:hypothetical protein